MTTLRGKGILTEFQLLCHSNPHTCNVPSQRWNVTLAHGWQTGGGLYIAGGTATLTNTNIYANRGGLNFDVCLNFEHSTFLEASCSSLLVVCRGRAE